MIKICLNKLINTNLEIGNNRINSIKKYLDYYDEGQLLQILSSPYGLIADDINIYYLQSTGFRCANDTRITGKLPICNIIQKKLNDELISQRSKVVLNQNKNVNFNKMDYFLEKINYLNNL